MNYLALSGLRAVAAALILTVTQSIFADTKNTYNVTYSGGSLSEFKGQTGARLALSSEGLRLIKNKAEVLNLPIASITELSYGQEVHRRIGTAAGLAVVSFGVGALVAFSKSKKHYIGLTWDQDGHKGGMVLQADKDEYRGLL